MNPVPSFAKFWQDSLGVYAQSSEADEVLLRAPTFLLALSPWGPILSTIFSALALCLYDLKSRTSLYASQVLFPALSFKITWQKPWLSPNCSIYRLTGPHGGWSVGGGRSFDLYCCRFPWCKYSHHHWFPATDLMSLNVIGQRRNILMRLYCSYISNREFLPI